MITQKYLKSILLYNQETGIFTWIFGNNKNVKSGNIIKTIDAKGYIVTKLHNKIYKAHRLAWLYMTGELPKLEIDHIDTNTKNNSWLNLRLATHKENRHNRTASKNNTSGFKGVHFHILRNKWMANIKIDGKKKYLGSFLTKEEASEAYNKAAIEMHKEYANVSGPKVQFRG